MALFVPPNFGQIEDNTYRSAWPSEINFSFIKSLGIKTIVALSSDNVDQKFMSFIEREGIRMIVVTGDSNPGHLSEKMVTEALRIILNEDNLPALICCTTGTVLTGVVVGCLRKLRKWSMISIYEEYRRFCGTRLQHEHENFIELFDNDLVQSN